MAVHLTSERREANIKHLFNIGLKNECSNANKEARTAPQ